MNPRFAPRRGENLYSSRPLQFINNRNPISPPCSLFPCNRSTSSPNSDFVVDKQGHKPSPLRILSLLVPIAVLGLHLCSLVQFCFCSPKISLCTGFSSSGNCTSWPGLCSLFTPFVHYVVHGKKWVLNFCHFAIASGRQRGRLFVWGGSSKRTVLGLCVIDLKASGEFIV